MDGTEDGVKASGAIFADQTFLAFAVGGGAIALVLLAAAVLCCVCRNRCGRRELARARARAEEAERVASWFASEAHGKALQSRQSPTKSINVHMARRHRSRTLPTAGVQMEQSPALQVYQLSDAESSQRLGPAGSAMRSGGGTRAVRAGPDSPEAIEEERI